MLPVIGETQAKSSSLSGVSEERFGLRMQATSQLRTLDPHSSKFPIMSLIRQLPFRQKGNGRGLLYLGLSALVIAVAVAAFLVLRGQEHSAQEEVLVDEQARVSQTLKAEPPPIKTVDMQKDAIQRKPQPSAPPRVAESAGQGGLFDRGGKTLPLTDGLAGGSEIKGNEAMAAERAPNAVDFFDYGVLDGRVRIGVFGKGGIPDYRVSVTDSLIVIEMPGEFRYVEEFSRTLQIQQFGVASAALARDPRGMRMSIGVTPQLAHQPFLIEDPQGLMVAFEPR